MKRSGSEQQPHTPKRNDFRLSPSSLVPSPDTDMDIFDLALSLFLSSERVKVNNCANTTADHDREKGVKKKRKRPKLRRRSKNTEEHKVDNHKALVRDHHCLSSQREMPGRGGIFLQRNKPQKRRVWKVGKRKQRRGGDDGCPRPSVVPSRRCECSCDCSAL